MDLNLIPFEPNLKFVSGLSEDLQKKYFEHHAKAKQTLAIFSHSLQNVYIEHQKLLADNVELSLINEKLKQIIDNESSQLRIPTFIDKPSSEILGASPNCKLEKISTGSLIKKANEKSNSQIFNEQKENINELIPIFSSDFNSDMDDEAFSKYKSPPPSAINTPEKVQQSPILSKRKRFSSKKSNSSISNTSSHSITSSNDSKISTTNTSNMLEKNINETEVESDREPEKEVTKEPLRTIENVFIPVTCNNDYKNKGVNVLSVSSTSYGRTEFKDKGKKLRQTTLTLKKIPPIIDISKVDSQESLNKIHSQCKVNSSSDETFFNGNLHNQIPSINQNYKKDISMILISKKESSADKNINAINNIKIENLDISVKDDEMIETSPAQNEKSKLRNKLRLKKRTEISKSKIRSPSAIKSETATRLTQRLNDNSNQFEFKIIKSNKKDQNFKENILESSSKKNQVIDSTTESNKLILFEPQKTLSDETYFSPAEVTNNKFNLSDCEMDITEFQNEKECRTPPAKKMLLDSFDMVPGRYEESPDFAYKETAVRSKNERALLQGWCCRDCKQWYGDLPIEEQQIRIKECSKHRAKHQNNQSTPDSFWNPEFD